MIDMETMENDVESLREQLHEEQGKNRMLQSQLVDTIKELRESNEREKIAQVVINELRNRAVVVSDEQEVEEQRVTDMKSVIIRNVLSYYDVTIEDVQSRNRQRQLVSIRRNIARLLREYTGLSLSEIGDVVGRDHSNVMHLLYKSYDNDGNKDVDSVREYRAYKNIRDDIEKEMAERMEIDNEINNKLNDKK